MTINRTLGMPWRLILLLLAILTGQCSSGHGDAELSRSFSLPVISAVGDSITLGVGSQTVGYPERLQVLLDKGGYRTLIRNLGISGEKAHQTRQRFTQILEHSDIILLMIGFNDLTRPQECPKPLGCRTLEYIEALIDMAAKKGIPVLLGTITPPQPGSIRSWAETVISQFNDELRQLASKHRIPLVETHKILAEHTFEGLYADHAHPNDKGYFRLAECWYDALVGCGLLLKEK